MNRSRSNKSRIFMGFALWCFLCMAGCEREPQVAAYSDAGTIEQRYGLGGAYTERIDTENGAIDATIVPITLSDGRSAEFVIPRQEMADHRLFLRDADGLSPVVLENPRVSREQFLQSHPRVVQRQVETSARNTKRSWQREALIVGGSNATGAAIGSGGQGTGVGMLSGGVAGLIYDLTSTNP
jgi:hypothetical protein